MDPKAVRDDAGAQATIREAQDRRVPDELMRQLHEANGRADDLRRHLDAALSAAEMDWARRAERVGEQLREVEGQIEHLEQLIRKASSPQAKS